MQGHQGDNQTNNEEMATEFLNYIGEHHQDLWKRFKAFCRDKKYTWDEDVFEDTIIKCYDQIKKKGMKDSSATGIENYFFMAFRQNTKREEQYARNANRTMVDNETLQFLYEKWMNTKETAMEKIAKDLYKDFVTLYIMHLVETNFDYEHFHLFKLKTLVEGMTYKKLQQETKIKGARMKCVEVRTWLKENVTRKQVDEAFNLMYGNMLIDE